MLDTDHSHMGARAPQTPEQVAKAAADKAAKEAAKASAAALYAANVTPDAVERFIRDYTKDTEPALKLQTLMPVSGQSPLVQDEYWRKFKSAVTEAQKEQKMSEYKALIMGSATSTVAQAESEVDDFATEFKAVVRHIAADYVDSYFTECKKEVQSTVDALAVRKTKGVQYFVPFEKDTRVLADRQYWTIIIKGAKGDAEPAAAEPAAAAAKKAKSPTEAIESTFKEWVKDKGTRDALIERFKERLNHYGRALLKEHMMKPGSPWSASDGAGPSRPRGGPRTSVTAAAAGDAPRRAPIVRALEPGAAMVHTHNSARAWKDAVSQAVSTLALAATSAVEQLNGASGRRADAKALVGAILQGLRASFYQGEVAQPDQTEVDSAVANSASLQEWVASSSDLSLFNSSGTLLFVPSHNPAWVTLNTTAGATTDGVQHYTIPIVGSAEFDTYVNTNELETLPPRQTQLSARVRTLSITPPDDSTLRVLKSALYLSVLKEMRADAEWADDEHIGEVIEEATGSYERQRAELGDIEITFAIDGPQPEAVAPDAAMEDT